MPKLTKDDIKALKSADVLIVGIAQRFPTGHAYLIKEIKGDNAVFPTSETIRTDRDLPAEFKVEGRWKLDDNDDFSSGRMKCWAHVSLYHNQHTHPSCIVNTLREGDELTFRFWPDAHNGGAEYGMHGDVLYLDVRRNDGKQYFHWELDHSFGPNNSARMCAGFPNSRSFQRIVSERRGDTPNGWSQIEA